MNIASILRNAARTFGDRPAVSIGDELYADYATMAARSAGLAAGLKAKLGLASGDRVLLAMSNCPQYFELLFAVWHAGLVAVPVNAKLHPKEIAWIAQDSAAKVCFCTADLMEAIIGQSHDMPGVWRFVCVDDAEYQRLIGDPVTCAVADRDDLAWVFYTSGTTGRPKGAMLSHLNLQLMAWSYLCDFDRLDSRDAMLHLAPQSHASGLLALPHIAKASHQILPPSGGFDPGELASLVDGNESLTFFLAPTMLRRVVEHGGVARSRIENVRTVIGGAAPFTAQDVRDALATFGPRFTNGYGQGECPCTISMMPKHLYLDAACDDELTSVGIARTGVEIAIFDAEGQPVASGEAGEIAVRSDIVMQGYLNRPDATREAIVDGWLRTGDMGVMDARGLLTLKDRSKDVIISGGSNIYPAELESVMLRLPGVHEVAVVGKVDGDWGEVPVAFIVAVPGMGVTAAALDAICLDNLARYKRPKAFVFVDHLPRNSTGKILKSELRATLSEPPY
ncbi:MAG: AMP-binding protein [Novosphingobium sp.]|uniref:class I adenylate-forming enzyme family protein n=1 Tax=Novosphingobium sp. TaxID=1874826 RepID=UPI002734A0E1|nr:AMP-binding protein [Novosphingobium sp.]MDP3550493.1 AMP-binding protein [Novosphingobium sp.]